MKKIIQDKIAEALYERIVHTQWENEGKKYIDKLCINKNISLDKNTIEIQNADGNKTYYKITVQKL